MVMEYMDHDLKSLMDDKQRFSQPFSAGQAKCLILQLLRGVAFLHDHWVLHRCVAWRGVGVGLGERVRGPG